jgi:hypothetical protein
MPKSRVTGEVCYIRVPAGTVARIERLRGAEKRSRYERRLLLAALAQAEAQQAQSTPTPTPAEEGP